MLFQIALPSALNAQQQLELKPLRFDFSPFIGYRTSSLPAFYTRDSDSGVDVRIDDSLDIARVMKAKWDLGLAGGLVIANPIPEQHALPRPVVDKAIDQALADARKQGITGKAVTPFLLARIKVLTGGRSLATNIALVKHNAEVGARLAVALAACRDF